MLPIVTPFSRRFLLNFYYQTFRALSNLSTRQMDKLSRPEMCLFRVQY
jgi:hypothetical protein